MSKLFLRSGVAAIALVFPVAIFAQTSAILSSSSTLNLDTGATGKASGGDILWNGTAVVPQGSATAVDLANTPLASLYGGGASSYSSLISQGSTLISEFSSAFSSYLTSSQITPKVNDIIVVKTNLGNYSAILISSIISGGSLTLQYDTFSGSSTGTGTTANGPTVSAIVNNYSNIPSGLPSYGIAPASLFVIYGSNLSGPASSLQSSAAPGLPSSLNQTSVSVTVNGTTVTPVLYYTSPGQIDAVLPSNTPAGTGTLTVTYNGTASAAANIVVAASAFGIDTLSGTGAGTIVATVGSSVITPTNSAEPNQTITIWGTGLGADPASSNYSTYPLTLDNLKNATVYIGGVQANVSYAGRSQYPGVDQINVTVPSGLSGCGISVVVVANGKASNFGSLPINAGGGVCSDPELGITGSEIEQITTQTSIRTGSVGLVQTTTPSVQTSAKSSILAAQTFTTSYYADAGFYSYSGITYASSSAFYSLGSCFVSEAASSTTGTSTSNGLDAGTPIVLTGGGLNVQLPVESFGGTTFTGTYYATLTSALLGGTAYTFTGPGGKDVGPFTATITFPTPLTWTNESSITTVTEAQGQLITWTGGATGTYVIISGDSSTSSTSASGPQSASFTCLAPVSAGQFTIPSYVLLTLPPGSGSLGIYNYTVGGTFTATGINYGSTFAGVSSSENVTYQ